MTCDICNGPAAYEVTHVSVMGKESGRQIVCVADAVTAASWVLSNNDEGFAGPGEVIETLTFRLLDPDRYRAMVAGSN